MIMSAAIGLEEWRIAAIFVFFLCGGMVKGVTGFGLPLATVSLTPLVAPPDLALALNTMVIPLTNALQIAQGERRKEALRICIPVLFGMALTVGLGAWIVASIPARALGGLLGGLLILFTVISFMAPAFRLPMRHDRKAGFGAGLLGGVMGAALTAPGPIFVMYFVSRGMKRKDLITAVGICMFIVGALVIASYAWAGVLTAPRALMSAAAAIPALLGMWLGARLAARMSVDAFHRVVLIVLLCLGVFHIAKAAMM